MIRVYSFYRAVSKTKFLPVVVVPEVLQVGCLDIAIELRPRHFPTADR